MKTKVLIVDDNSDNLYLLKTIFEGQGWGVSQAANGKVALEMAKDQAPDLIVSDILMPVMDGYTLCRQCKSDEKLKNIPFVFYTGTCTEPKDEKFTQDLGADRFVLKPKKPAALIKILIDLLEEKKVTSGTAKPLGEEMEFFRRHNEILFRKLEKKMSDLEAANQELRMLEENYRLSFENVSDVIYTLDTDLNILSVSPGVEKVLGYRPQDFIGRSIADVGPILTPQSLEQGINYVSRICKGETMPSSVYEFIAKDGTIKIGEVSGSPIMRDGKISGMIAVARDITNRKQAEEALRESEERFRILTESSPTAILLYQNDKWIYANPAATEIMGYTAQELLSMNFWNIVHPDDRRTVKERGKKRQQAVSVTSRYEFRIVCKDGMVKWVDLSGATIVYNGSPAGIISVLEITERKKMEEALREGEKKYRTILEDMEDVYFEVDIKGNITFVNLSSCKMSGYSEEELLGMPFKKISEPNGIEMVMKHFGEIILTGKTGKPFIWNLVKKNGEQGFFELVVSLIRDVKGKPIGFKGIGRDITERMQTDAKLHKTLDRLSKAVSTTIHVLAAAVEARDPYTAGHQTRAADLARAIAEEMGLPSEKIDGILMAGSIHDIGKLSVPAEILTKSSKLSNIEFALIKEHAEKGREMLKDVESPWPLSEMVYQHHERMDGSGYPRNLKGGEILMEARILAVADVVEAMASHRPYRPSLGLQAALDEIEKNSGILYDKAVADACLRLFRKKGYHLPEIAA